MLRAMLFFPVALLGGCVLTGCSLGAVQTHRPAAPALPQLSWVFDCLRTNRLALVSAHRGQKTPQAVENSLDGGTETYRRGIAVLEADVARSSDGVPMLLRGDTLDRTTTGTGPISGKTYRELRQLWLRTPSGEVTDERIPTLDEALVLARRGSVILMLDAGRSMPVTDLVHHIRSGRMERHVILVARSLAESRALLQLAPEMMVAAAPRDTRERQALIRLANPHLLIFADTKQGTTPPDPALVATLDAARVEAITTTHGKPSLDEIQAADGDRFGYARLAEQGVVLISSNRPVDAWKALKAAERDGTYCLTGDRS